MNYDEILNQTLRVLKPSGIRRFFDIASEMENVISLSIGEPDFSTPWHIRQEGIRTLEAGKTWYSPNAGLMKLREAIAAYVQRHSGVTYAPKDEVLVTVGGSEAIDLGFRALLNPGDEVLIPEPCFVCYEPLSRMAGGVGGADCHPGGRRIPADGPPRCGRPSRRVPRSWCCRSPTIRREASCAASIWRKSREVLRGTGIMVLSDRNLRQSLLMARGSM